MIVSFAALPAAGLAALAELEQRTVAVDGGRLKLEWGVLRTRSGAAPNDLLWWEGDRLAGFVGLYGFGPPDVELAGMVDPAYRRRGIGSALLAAALPLCRDRAYAQALLVTPRNDAGGREFALAHRAVLEHSEYALLQRRPPHDAPEDPAVIVRAAVAADVPDLARLFAAGFGDAPDDITERLLTDPARTDVVERDGRVIGTLRMQVDDGTGAIYGFTIDPALQGQGIGRDVLRRACRRLWADGAQAVRLEVAVDNPAALHLYTSLGFEPVMTEDYYAIAL